MFDEQNQFIENLGGELSPEQAAILLSMADGDTAPAETNEAPDVGTEPEQEEAAKEAEADKVEADNQEAAAEPKAEEDPVVLAKDGKHTIPYEKLVEAREAEKAWREAAAKAERELEELRKQAAEPSKQAADEPADIEDEDFENLFDADKKAIERAVEKAVLQRQAEIESKLLERLKPFEEQRQLDVAAAHYRTIYEAHPDADSVAESKELAEWIQSQPTYAQSAIKEVLSAGTAGQVVEVLNAFKAAAEPKEPAVDAEAAKEKAKAVVENTKAAMPNTLTDIPSGHPPAKSEAESLAAMSAAEVAEVMASWPPEKIERYLNSQ